MSYTRSIVTALLLSLFNLSGAIAASADSGDGGGSYEARGKGAGVSFAATVPKGYELQGLGPEWYVVKKGTTRPLVLVKFQMGKTLKGLVADGFERVDDRERVEFADNVTGTVIVGSYEAPPEEKYVQPWYLHPAPGEDGVFMIAEYRAQPWPAFRDFAASFRYTGSAE